MSLRAFAGYHAHILWQTTYVWIDMGQIFYYLIRNFVYTINKVRSQIEYAR